MSDIGGIYAKTSPAFRAKLEDLCSRLDIPVDWLAAIIAFETGGTWSPTVRPLNAAGQPLSSAVGLLQWTRARAATIGLTTEQLLAMTAEEQLEAVEYTFGTAPPLDSPREAYMWVFAPAYVKAPPGQVLYARPSAAYAANAALDRDRDGTITSAEAAEPIYELLEMIQPGSVTSRLGRVGSGVAIFAVVSAAIAATVYAVRRRGWL